MKKSYAIVIAVVLVLAVLLTVGASLTALAEPSQPVETTHRIAHVSDIHIMIDEYCNIYSPDYQKAGNTSYKVLEQTAATAEAVFNEMIVNAGGIPEMAFITGDLTSNGELANHLGVAKLLAEITQRARAIEGNEGFQIFVIPGNHDIDNQNAKCYTPTLDDETWNALVAEGNADKMRDYLSQYPARSVQTTTMLEFMSIYSDFGYCNCAGRKEGHHEGGCKMAEGVSLEYFYESDYWYVPNTTRSNRPVDLGDAAVALTPSYTYRYEYEVTPAGALTETTPTEDEIAGYKVDKDMEFYARASRHGACSYIARVNGVTVLGIDANSHKWTDVKKDKLAVKTSLGWDETTGGYMTEAQLNWMIESVREDVADRRLVLTLAHENVLPHFDTEDEVISLFTYDNWEDVYTNMADNGMRYVFTGHQHTNDIESEISQMGSVFYDLETGSTTCMGAGWRELKFTQTAYADGAYAEDCWSTMHYLHYNTEVDGQKAFAYRRYEITGGSTDGTYSLTTVYQGKNGVNDHEGEYQDMTDYMSQSLQKMISNMAGNVVNEQLMDTIGGLVGKLEGGSLDYLYPLANKVVTDLGNLNLYEFVADADGGFHLSAEPKAGYHLTQYAIDLVDYFLGKDYSFGKKLGVYLDEVLLEVYGNHLIGGQFHTEAEITAKLQALLDVLEDGQFLRYFEDLLYRGVLPELELILNAPIYWGDSINYRHLDQSSTVTPEMVADGKGFDVSAQAGAVFSRNDFIIGAIKGLIEPQKANKYRAATPGMDVSSLMKFVRSLPTILDPILHPTEDGDDTLMILIDAVAEDFDIGKYLHYIDKAVGYIVKLDGTNTLAEVLKEELLDKYVTDAFCKNLGAYGAYIIRSVMVDDSVDGVERTAAEGWFPYEVTPDFHVTLTYAGDKSALFRDGVEHTYYCDKDGKDTVAVKATKANGLLPGKITLGNVVDASGNLDLTKKEIRWFTQRDVDYSTPAATCKQYEWSEEGASAATQFYSELELADNAQFTSSTTRLYKGANVWIEYPTIDLGIIYLNITYAYRQYNDFDVVLDGLTAGKTYYYRLRAVDVDGEGKTSKTYDWTDTYSFTQPQATGGVSVMAMADIQGSVEGNYVASLLNMKEALSNGNPAFIVNCGDNVDTGKNIAQWQWLLDDQDVVWAQNVFAGVAGNHEEKDYAISSVVATPDVAAVEASGFFYSYNYQNVHFVLLNTNDNKSDGTLADAQYAWLEADLTAANANSAVEFIVVALHKGPYTAGSHAFDADVIAMRRQLSPLFAQKKVDLVLQGHDHTYSVSEYIGATADDSGKYLPVAVSYDATGAAIDPDGVLYVNLGTMGDKYYNYIYSPLVTLRDRTADAHLKVTLADYLTQAGNLELSPVRNGKTVLPETPVYAYLNVKAGRLSLTTYTVINGNSYVVDDIAITKSPVKASADLSVLAAKVKAADLDTLATVRVSVTTTEGVEFFAGYRLADVLAKAGKAQTSFRYNGTDYSTADAYVVVAKSNAAGGDVTAMEPTVMICNQGSALFVAASELSSGLPTWAIAVIAVASAVVLALVVVLVLLVLKRKKAPTAPAPTVAEGENAPSANDEPAPKADAEDASNPDEE